MQEKLIYNRFKILWKMFPQRIMYELIELKLNL